MIIIIIRIYLSPVAVNINLGIFSIICINRVFK